MTKLGILRRASLTIAAAGMLGLCLVPTATASGGVTSRGVGYWPFDGNARDATGHGHHGVVQGATPIADGAAGGAYRFDGNDAITLGALDWVFRDGVFSISLWARSVTPAAPEAYMLLVSKLDAVSGTGPVAIYVGDGRMLPGACETTNGLFAILWEDWVGVDPPPPLDGTDILCNRRTSAVNFRDGVWHMVTATVSPAERALYIDGVRVLRSRLPLSIPRADGRLLSVGGMSFPCCSTPWIGDLDEVRLYNEALKPAQVMALFEDVVG